MTTGSSTFIDLSSIDRPCSAERTSDERQANELVEKNQETDQAPADSNPVRRRSGRFVVESVMQHVRAFSSSRSCDASYTADDDDDMWLEREQSPTLPPLHQRFLSRTAMSKRQSRLKSILKNARSVSFCQPSSNETSPPPPISTRHKRVSFSEIVTKQLYKSDESQTESRRGKDKQKKKNKNQSDFPSRKARQTPPSKNGRPLNEQRKQPDLLLESLSSFFSLSSKKEDCEDITDEFIEVEDKSIEEDQSIIDDDDKSIAEDDDEWNEVTHRRRRNFKHGGGSPLKRCDSELSDESGFGSLPSSFDEENCAINKLCDDAVFSSIEKTGYEEEDEDESSILPLPSHQKDKYQDVNRLIQQMLSCAMSSDGDSVPVVND